MSDEEGQRKASQRFAENLKAVREHRSMSQADLAREMAARGWKWHQSTVYKAEQGARVVSIDEADALARILGVTIDRFTWATAEAGEVALTDRAIEMIHQSWHETSEAAFRLLGSLAAGQRQLAAAQASKYKRVRGAAAELDAEIRASSLESAVSDGAARYENPGDD